MFRFLLVYCCALVLILSASILFKKEALAILQYRAFYSTFYNLLDAFPLKEDPFFREHRHYLPGYDKIEYVCKLSTSKEEKVFSPGESVEIKDNEELHCPRGISFVGSGKIKLLRMLRGDFVFEFSGSNLRASFSKSSFFLSSDLGFLRVESSTDGNVFLLTFNEKAKVLQGIFGELFFENLSARIDSKEQNDTSYVASYAAWIQYRERVFGTFWKELSPPRILLPSAIFPMNIASLSHSERRSVTYLKPELSQDWVKDYPSAGTAFVLLSQEVVKDEKGNKAKGKWVSILPEKKKCSVWEIISPAGEIGDSSKKLLGFDSLELSGEFLVNYEKHKGNSMFLRCEAEKYLLFSNVVEI